MVKSSTEELEAAKQLALEALQQVDVKSEGSKRKRRRKRKRTNRSTPNVDNHVNTENGHVDGNEAIDDENNVRDSCRSNKVTADISDDETDGNHNNETTDYVEYQPESTVGIVKRARLLSEHDTQQIVDIVSRFEKRLDTTQPKTDVEHQAEVPVIEESVIPVPGRIKQPEKENDGADETIEKTTENDEDENENKEPIGVSRKKWKEERRNLISKLKGIVPDPSVVEAWDITATDPVLLTTLKCVRNSVPVPINWRQKRKYLQNKRGLEKRTIHLPHYIEQLGIGSIRDSQRDADGKKTLKQKQREKMRAKLNLSLLSSLRGGDNDQSVMEDEQRLHDAFFKYQTKPSLTSMGDLYYELRELQVDHSSFKPEVLSQELQSALGATEGDPPPWLIGMQRWGPPPSYPGLKIPGLNFPIPPGKSFGFGPGQFGKPPVDAHGRPLYGDVFAQGLNFESRDKRFDITDTEKTWVWGRLRNDLEHREPETDENETEPQRVDADDVLKTADGSAKLNNRSSYATNKSDAQTTPSGQRHDSNGTTAKVYRVLPERRNTVGQSNMFGSSHVYDVNVNNASGQSFASEEPRQDPTTTNKTQSELLDNNKADGNSSEKFKF